MLSTTAGLTPSFTVTSYVPAGKLVRSWVVAVKPFGPVQAQVQVPKPPITSRSMVPLLSPKQRISVLVRELISNGPPIRLTVYDCIRVQPLASVMVTTQVPPTSPEIFWVVAVNPFGPVQTQVQTGLPPETVIFIEPLELPKGFSSNMVTELMVTLFAGSVIVAEAVFTQPLLSVTKTL